MKRVLREVSARAGKTRIAAHAMVNAIWAGTAQNIRVMAPDDVAAARMMEAFYSELNDQMGWGRVPPRHDVLVAWGLVEP